MCPASPQSITRCAMLIPAPAMFACSFKVGDFVDRTAVNSHSDAEVPDDFQRLANFQRT